MLEWIVFLNPLLVSRKIKVGREEKKFVEVISLSLIYFLNLVQLLRKSHPLLTLFISDPINLHDII